jgi:hypothetical protein
MNRTWRIERTSSRPEELYSVVNEKGEHSKVLLVYVPATKKNAQLLAAAPKMLAALKALTGYYLPNGPDGFVACVTPKSASNLTKRQRRQNTCWSKWDAALEAIAEAER